MAITVTDRGEFQTAAGGSITIAATSTSWTPTAGSIIALATTVDALRGGSGTDDITFVITDTFGDSGGGAWTLQATCTRGGVVGSNYAENVRLFTRVIGTGPGSGAVTATGSSNSGATTTSTDGWLWCDVVEVTGQHATPIGASTGTTSRQAAGPTSFSLTLSGAPAAASLIMSVIHGDNTGTPATKPSGWTDLNEEHPAWGAASGTADLNGGGITTFSWTGLDAASNYLSCALEIVSAGAAPVVVPQYTPLVWASSMGLR